MLKMAITNKEIKKIKNHIDEKKFFYEKLTICILIKTISKFDNIVHGIEKYKNNMTA